MVQDNKIMKNKLTKRENRVLWLRALVKKSDTVAKFVRDNAQNGEELNEIYIRQLLNDKDKSFGEKSAAKIERACGLVAGFLDTPFVDDDQMLRENLAWAKNALGETLFDDPGYIRFNLLDVRAAAGNGAQIVEFPEVVKQISVLESWAKANLPVDLTKIKVISARGTSMQGTIENGDVLFVDSTVRAYDGDGIYIIARGNDVQVKRLQKLNGDVLAIISDNRAYESERLSGEDAESVVVCGRVLAAWTIRKFW